MAAFEHGTKAPSEEGRALYWFRCPGCKQLGRIDDDQFHGRVSIQCPMEGCTYHETKDLSKEKP